MTKYMVIKLTTKFGMMLFVLNVRKQLKMAKLSYLTNLGDKLNNPNTSQKSYWKIINRVMNKCRAPKIPLLVNNSFILNCKDKAKYLNNFFSQQCKPNSSVLPVLNFLTEKRIDRITTENEEIISLIRKINSGKATGSDGISGQILLFCDDSVIPPLKIIFSKILSTSINPDLCKLLM